MDGSSSQWLKYISTFFPWLHTGTIKKGVIALEVPGQGKFKVSLCYQISQGHLNRVGPDSRSFCCATPEGMKFVVMNYLVHSCIWCLLNKINSWATHRSTASRKEVKSLRRFIQNCKEYLLLTSIPKWKLVSMVFNTGSLEKVSGIL